MSGLLYAIYKYRMYIIVNKFINVDRFIKPKDCCPTLPLIFLLSCTYRTVTDFANALGLSIFLLSATAE